MPKPIKFKGQKIPPFVVVKKRPASTVGALPVPGLVRPQFPRRPSVPCIFCPCRSTKKLSGYHVRHALMDGPVEDVRRCANCCRTFARRPPTWSHRVPVQHVTQSATPPRPSRLARAVEGIKRVFGRRRDGEGAEVTR